MCWPIPRRGCSSVPTSCSSGRSVLFALDSLAQRLDVPKGRRAVLCFAEATILWVVDARMGHPEDALALAFAIYALLALWSGRSTRAGWLFGLGVLFQPLVLLMLPLVLVWSPSRRRVPVVASRRGAVDAGAGRPPDEQLERHHAVAAGTALPVEAHPRHPLDELGTEGGARCHLHRVGPHGRRRRGHPRRPVDHASPPGAGRHGLGGGVVPVAAHPHRPGTLVVLPVAPLGPGLGGGGAWGADPGRSSRRRVPWR